MEILILVTIQLIAGIATKVNGSTLMIAVLVRVEMRDGQVVLPTSSSTPE